MMDDYLVVVSGGGHSRFFTLESAELPELESSPRLVECGKILNPEKDVPGKELYSDSKTGRGKAPGGGPSHGYDDHRSQHEDEFDRRFAKRIIDETKRLARQKGSRRIIMVAPAQMLGLLRQNMDAIQRPDLKVQELAKDMSKFTSEQIHNHLAKEGIIPPRKRPGT
ncbi:MAG: host attachment protein [Deltaproteobacteria bacterium]|nr:host attachment protein [Deltaproteobacteria bacterium]